MPRLDLHSHSTASDGVLSPRALIERAAGRGVDVLALTDHDELAGLAEAEAAARESAIELVRGTEISACFEGRAVHVLGLHIDPADCALVEGLAWLRDEREARARRIAASLAEAGIPGTFEGASALVTNPRLVSRTHFARHLVQRGLARDIPAVFKRYLAPGRPGYVPQTWATISQAVAWIHGAGGMAIVAHPGRYAGGRAAIRRLLETFRDAGGDGIEILSPSHSSTQCADFIALARILGLSGSCGSDFHSPEESSVDLGELADLPAGVKPIWASW